MYPQQTDKGWAKKLQKSKIHGKFLCLSKHSQSVVWDFVTESSLCWFCPSARHWNPCPLCRAATLVRILMSSWNKNKAKCPFLLPGDANGCKGRTCWLSWRDLPDENIWTSPEHLQELPDTNIFPKNIHATSSSSGNLPPLFFSVRYSLL